jgi:hypothetical protein
LYKSRSVVPNRLRRASPLSGVGALRGHGRKAIELSLGTERARFAQPRAGDAQIVIAGDCALDQAIESFVAEAAPPLHFRFEGRKARLL